MAFSVNDIQFFYSGGAGNSDPNASLGGIVSSTRIASQTPSTPVNVTGVVLDYAVNNAQGTGILSWSPGTNALSWQPPGSASVYTESNLTVDGTYVIGGGDGILVCTVTVASLPSTYKQDSITITNVSQNVFDSVGPIDSLQGSDNYRCIYVKNTHGSVTANNVKVWIKQNTTGPDDLSVGLDPAGVGDGSTTGVATTVADEDTAPAGVTFSQPLTYAAGLNVGTLAPGDCIAVWQKRNVPANTTGDITANTSVIACAVTI